jgi:hypothetical protein
MNWASGFRAARPFNCSEGGFRVARPFCYRLLHTRFLLLSSLPRSSPKRHFRAALFSSPLPRSSAGEVAERACRSSISRPACSAGEGAANSTTIARTPLFRISHMRSGFAAKLWPSRQANPSCCMTSASATSFFSLSRHRYSTAAQFCPAVPWRDPPEH